MSDPRTQTTIVIATAILTGIGTLILSILGWGMNVVMSMDATLDSEVHKLRERINIVEADEIGRTRLRKLEQSDAHHTALISLHEQRLNRVLSELIRIRNEELPKLCEREPDGR